MPAKKINHIGIAVHSIEESLPFYRDVLCMKSEGTEEVPEQKVRVAFLGVGESRIELLEPTAADSPVAKFLEKNGPGIHHLAYEVADLGKALAALKEQGVRLIDASPRLGAHGMSIAFLHPKASGGVLTELCQSGSVEDHSHR
jgi:methylmalonyl-CoA/ethylmalonyl-CoA epimerase